MANRYAYRQFPRLVHANRFAANGNIPDAQFLGELVFGQNHIMAHRRKVVFRVPARMDSVRVGSAGTINLWRFRFHAGYGATKLQFLIAFGVDVNSASGDPRIDIDVTEAGGATTTRTVRAGAVIDATKGVTTTPSLIQWSRISADITANTTYEVLVKTIDYCRPLGMTVIESANTSLSTDYFHELEPGVDQPIYDSTRQRTLQGLSQIWRRNGSQLLNWSFPDTTSSSSAPTFASTTWTNVIDATTAVAASSAGFYLGDSNFRLNQWCRLSDATTLDVVLAVHASMSAGSTGEVRLQDSGVTRCSITGITTTPQWHTTSTTIANCDTLGKVDLQARTSNAANTLTLNAVSLYTYLA
jgi:hypothetical protein